jgi:hypothetical protein
MKAGALPSRSRPNHRLYLGKVRGEVENMLVRGGHLTSGQFIERFASSGGTDPRNCGRRLGGVAPRGYDRLITFTIRSPVDGA